MTNPTASSIDRQASLARRALARAVGVLACVLAAGAPLGGCNLAGPVLAVVAGPTDNSALYTLPKERTTVVFIDDRANRIPSRSARERVGLTVERTLLQKGVVKDMVQSRLVLSAVRTERFGEPMTIAEVGRSVKADTVIYATVDAWSLSPDGQTYAPQAILRVKVVDAETDERLWPADTQDTPGGYELLQVTVPEQSTSIPQGTSGMAQANADLASWVGLRLAQMFYDHFPEEVPTKLNSRDLSR